MIELLVLAFPLLLMAFMLIMERVEAPIRREADAAGGDPTDAPEFDGTGTTPRAETDRPQQQGQPGGRVRRRLQPASTRAANE